MVHKWTYRGDDTYACDKCGVVADKQSVRDVSATDCPGDAGNEALAQAVSALAVGLEHLNVRVNELEGKQEVTQ